MAASACSGVYLALVLFLMSASPSHVLAHVCDLIELGRRIQAGLQRVAYDLDVIHMVANHMAVVHLQAQLGDGLAELGGHWPCFARIVQSGLRSRIKARTISRLADVPNAVGIVAVPKSD